MMKVNPVVLKTLYIMGSAQKQWYKFDNAVLSTQEMTLYCLTIGRGLRTLTGKQESFQAEI